VVALAPQRFALQLTIGQSTYEKLQYAQALLGHQLAPGDLPAVFDRALDALIGQLEQRKFAATAKPRPRRATPGKRQIPAHVRRAVWERDGGQCTFVSQSGQRCPARTRLEYDHLEPVARGGRATVEGVRLKCRAHNQYAAECTFGTAFMSHKRQEAQRAAALRAAADEQGEERDVVPWLRRLGLRADEARRAALRCESIPDASLEERLRLALSCLRPPHRRVEQGLGGST
jgi:5-methylcytosine-specific restriction endonuclease McrA